MRLAWLLVGVLCGCDASTAAVTSPASPDAATPATPAATPAPAPPDMAVARPDLAAAPDLLGPAPTLPTPPTGDPLALGTARQWTYYTIDGALCRDGSPAGLAVSPNPASDRLMIYLEGGGACYDERCDFTSLQVPYFPPPDGIFDRTNSANPVRDWNMIYLPYCTGDVWAGDAPDTVLKNLLGIPVKNQFVGYRNIGLFLARIVPTFPRLKQVLLTGISAGGFGAGLNAERVQRAFGAVPVVLVDDSGPPMSGHAIASCLQKKWREVWNLDATVLAACGADCPNPDDYALDLLRHVIKTYPTSVGGLFSNEADLVIRGFYGAGQDDCQPSPLDLLVPADTYHNELLALRAMVTAAGGPFGTYFDSGFGHTCLRGACFVTENVDGVPLARWLGDLLDGKATQVGN
jgi:hypothetical protein